MSSAVRFDSRPARASSRPMAISRRRIANFSSSAAFSRRSRRRASRTTSLALPYSPEATSRFTKSTNSSERLTFIVAIFDPPTAQCWPLANFVNPGSAGARVDVKALYMSWSRQSDGGGRRGYHHGNLREALVRAALELIAQKGPAGFTFADAARWAGVIPAAPYRHFRDRDALLADVARRGFELFEAALSHAWNDGRPEPYRAFENVGRAYLAFARNEPAHYSAMRSEERRVGKEWRGGERQGERE